MGCQLMPPPPPLPTFFLPLSLSEPSPVLGSVWAVPFCRLHQIIILKSGLIFCCDAQKLIHVLVSPVPPHLLFLHYADRASC